MALTFTLVQTVFLSLAGPETSNAEFWHFQEGQVMQVCEFFDHAQEVQSSNLSVHISAVFVICELNTFPSQTQTLAAKNFSAR